MRAIGGTSTVNPIRAVRAPNASARAQMKNAPIADRQNMPAEGSIAASKEKGRTTTATQNKRLLRGTIIQGHGATLTTYPALREESPALWALAGACGSAECSRLGALPRRWRTSTRP